MREIHVSRTLFKLLFKLLFKGMEQACRMGSPDMCKEFFKVQMQRTARSGAVSPY